MTTKTYLRRMTRLLRRTRETSKTREGPLRVLAFMPYYPPERGAASTRLGELTRFWAEAGVKVEVIAGMPCYPTGVVPEAYRGHPVIREHIQGVDVLRTYVIAQPNHTAAQRFITQASASASAALAGLALAREADLVFASSPHLFGAVAAAVCARAKGIPFLLELRDLWPRIIWQTGTLPRDSAVIRALEEVELWLYAQADQLVVVTEGFRDEVAATSGVSRDAIPCIPNGVDTRRFLASQDVHALRARFGLPLDKPIALYAGVHGIPQGLETVVEAARMCPEVHWALLGDGGQKADLVARGRDVDNLSFLDPVRPEHMAAVYAMADVQLALLRDVPSLRSTIPSKIFEILAAARPLVLSAAGESAALVDRSGGGVAVDPESGVALAEGVRSLLADPQAMAEMGHRGRAFVQAHHERRTLAERYAELLRDVVAAH